jgi:hypothetical protein
MLAVAGELTCVTAAIIGLPAFLLMRQRKAAAVESGQMEVTAQQ